MASATTVTGDFIPVGEHKNGTADFHSVAFMVDQRRFENLSLSRESGSQQRHPKAAMQSRYLACAVVILISLRRIADYNTLNQEYCIHS